MMETPQVNDLNQRLKAAVQSVPAPPYLEARIRSGIQAAERPRSPFLRLIPIAAVVMLVAAIGIPYQQGHLRYTKGSKESYIVSVSNRLVSLMRPGLGDHVNCSVFRKYPKNAPAVEELAKKLPVEYRGLIPVVQRQIPDTYKVLITHQCRYHGRRFVHLSMEDDSHVLSLVITRRTAGESFAAEGLLPALAQSDIPMYQSGVQRFAMTAFETPGFLVYFVSDLPQQENTRMMLAMAPGVKGVLKSLEN
jgi:hypothetical protein